MSGSSNGASGSKPVAENATKKKAHVKGRATAAEKNGTRQSSRKTAAANKNDALCDLSDDDDAVAPPTATASKKKKSTSQNAPPKYPINTPLSKVFQDDVDGTDRLFSGKVVAYDVKTKFYSIRYEDDDAEEMMESELSKYVANLGGVGKRKKNAKRNDDVIMDDDDDDDVMEESDDDDDEKQYKTKKVVKKPRITAAAAAKKKEEEPTEILTSGRTPRRSAKKKINYAYHDDDDNMLDDDSFEEEEEVVERTEKKKKPKRANSVNNDGKKGEGKKTKKKKADDSDSDAFELESESEAESDDNFDDFSDDDDDDYSGKKKKAKKPAAKKKNNNNNKPQAKGKDGEKKTSMAEAFAPLTTPLYCKLSLPDIKKMNEPLDPCGMEATDDIIDSIVGEQLDRCLSLLCKALEYDGENSTLGSKNNPLLLGTACSGTDAPALALTLVQEQLEKRGLGDIFKHNHAFSCEKEPFKQAYLARNFDSVLYPGKCFLPYS